MKRFRFALDGTLRVRQVQLKSEEAKLRELLAGEQRLRKSLEAIGAERAEAAAFIQQDVSDTLSLQALSSYLIGLDMRRITLKQSLENLLASIRAQRELVAALQRDEKLLMRLHDKKLSEWQAAISSEAEAIAQECWLATRRFDK
jgi:flagellar export protein FliJ